MRGFIIIHQPMALHTITGDLGMRQSIQLNNGQIPITWKHVISYHSKSKKLFY